jgi:hypothetical protein
MRQTTAQGTQRQPRAQPHEEDLVSQPSEDTNRGIVRPHEASPGLYAVHPIQQGLEGAIISNRETATIEVFKSLLRDRRKIAVTADGSHRELPLSRHSRASGNPEEGFPSRHQ